MAKSGSPKRKAAAEVFRQQNMMPQEELADMDRFDDAEFDDAPAGGFQPQAPSPKQSKIAAPLAEALSAIKTSEELQLEKEPIRVRETGLWLFKRVIVPPNAYVVHTRIGRAKPVTLGLGLSFRYNPFTDAYLVVPAAMQTIGVISNCISKEKQGINVLAYVQWQIDDFSVAYRKLDFSDATDPLGIVNAQLREQADAAIKDKIATMSVEEVLTDKAPVIEELTRRLTQVTEGRARDSDAEDEGLGIKIVTVQIKEAFVSSQSLWENLQAPYRHEQERIAQISLLDMREEIRTKQLDTRRTAEISEAETEVQIERVKQEKRTEGLQVRLDEEEKRKQREQALRASELLREQEHEREKARIEAATQAELRTLELEQKISALEEEQRLAETKAEIEQQRLQSETELQQALYAHKEAVQALVDALELTMLTAELQRQQQKSEHDLELEQAQHNLAHSIAQDETSIARLQQEVANLANEQALLQQWIETLPEVAQEMPEIQDMRVIQSGDSNSLATFLAQQGNILQMIRDYLKTETAEANE